MRMGRAMRIAGVVLVILLGILLLEVRGTSEVCYACQRGVHAHSKTVAEAGGRAHLFCCPACALSQHAKITGLTSFATSAALAPDNAWVVRGSDVNMCVRTQELIGADKRAADLRYDRCLPGILAFARREEAARFAAEHGGEVLRFAGLSEPR
jgi:hypothetical protein